MHDHDEPHGSSAGHRLGTAFALNLAFTIVEIVGGLWTNSVAIVADAVHDLGDSLSLGLAWFLARYAQRSGDEVFSFGYHRFSLLGALVNALVLFVGSFFVLSLAIPRIFAPEPAHAPGMMGLAVLGLVANGVAVWRLRGGNTLNERVVTWHLMEDVLGWAAVLVVGGAILIWDLYVLDPILSVLITLVILWNVFRSLKETLVIFLQGTPSSLDRAEIESEILAFSGVAAVHHTHVWSQDGERHVLTTHVVLDGSPSHAAIDSLRSRIKQRLGALGVTHSTLEMETDDGACTDENH